MIGNPVLKSTLLFFDDSRLNRSDNVVRRIGRPTPIAESLYRDPFVNTAWGFPSVFFDAPSGKWRMAYGGWDEERRRYALLAESVDGISWSPRDTTGENRLENRAYPHQIISIKDFSELSTCYMDPFAPPGERLKALVICHPSKLHITTSLWVSDSGTRWERKEGVEWQRPGSDPGTFVFRNDVRGSCVFTSRPDWTDRRIAVYETRDWQTFTEPELALQADALDQPLTDPYGMPVIPYEEYYIGLLWLYHTVPQVKGYSPHKFYGGHVDCQLAYSLNGWHFQRCLRDPFMANGEPDDPDSGCVYPSCLIAQPDGSLRIYASACTSQHGYIPKGSGSLLSYRLRKDGFVYLESANGAGIIGTRPLYVAGSDLRVNLQCPYGEVRAQLTDHSGDVIEGYSFDDCRPARDTDDTAWVPRWEGDRTMAAHVRQVVRLELKLDGARVYAIRGGFRALTGGECWRCVSEGLVPSPRKGF